MEISAEERRRFDNEGYLNLPGIISLETVERLRCEADAILDQLISRMREAKSTDPRVTWWRLASGRIYVLKIKSVLELSPTVSCIANEIELIHVVGNLLGAVPRLMDDKFMYKQILNTRVPWAQLPVLGEEVRKHTDAAYFEARGFTRVLTVAVCLDDCVEASGALRVWPSSHRQIVDQVPTLIQGPVVPDHVAPDDASVVLEATAGSVLMWDARLVHASGPNMLGRPRRLLVLGYAPTSSQRA